MAYFQDSRTSPAKLQLHPAAVHCNLLQPYLVVRFASMSKTNAFAWFCADDELAGQAKKKKARTAKGRKEYVPNKGDANWVVVLMLLKVT